MRRRVVAAVAVFAAVAVVPRAVADEPYRTMLDEPMVFTGTESSDPAADDRGEIRIGLFAPDGDTHPVGRDLTRGVMSAVERANAGGGIDGVPLRVIRRWADDPWGAGSKEVIRLVFDDRVRVLIGGPDGASTHVAQQIATKAHLPLIAPLSGDPSLTHTRVPWIFRLPPDDRAQAELLVAEGMAPRGVRRAALVTADDHDGRTAAHELGTAMARGGRPPAFELAVDPGLGDPRALASRIAELAPDGVVLRLPGPSVRRALAALAAAGLSCPVFLPWLPDLDNVPPGYPGQVVEVRPYPASSNGGLQMSPATVYGFDAANLVIDALRSSGGGRADLQRGLAAIEGAGVSGVIRWDNGGGNTAAPVLVVHQPAEVTQRVL